MTDGERGTVLLQLEKGVSGTSSFKPTAAPFVPSGSLTLSRPGSASTMAVHAAPFVPGKMWSLTRRCRTAAYMISTSRLFCASKTR